MKGIIMTKIRETPLRTDPFPHIYIDDFLPDELYQGILRYYPTSDTFKQSGKDVENNVRYQISMKEIYGDERYVYYREIIEQVFDVDFFRGVMLKFGHSPDGLTVGRRFIDDHCDVKFDFQPGINSPVTKTCSVRNPHVDSPEELFAGLLYLRDPCDESVGGDLELYEIEGKPRLCRKQKLCIDGRTYLKKNEITNTECLRKTFVVPYASNNFIMFENSKTAIHGVSPRNVTEHERRLLNIIYER